MQYIQVIPLLLSILYLVFVWKKVIRSPSRPPHPELARSEEAGYFEDPPGLGDPAGLWKEMSPGQKRVVQRALIVALLLLTTTYMLWFIPVPAPDWVWEKAEAVELPSWFKPDSAVSYASPTQWRIIFSGTMPTGSPAEAVYTYSRLSGNEHLVATVGGARVRVAFAVILVLVSVVGIWVTVRESLLHP